MSEDITLIQVPQPSKTCKFVKVRPDGSVMHYELPIDKHFNDSTGVNWWVTHGFQTEESYQHKQHEKEVAERIAKAQAEAERLEAANRAAAEAAEKSDSTDKKKK